MKDICILGNGITAYILALLLNKKNVYVNNIDINRKNINLSNVISLKLNVLSDDEKKFLKDKIDYSDCIVHKKVGYKFNNKIYENATQEMINNYLYKQNRDIIYDFKFEQEFDTIDIVSLINKYKNKIEEISDEFLPKDNAIYIITNSQFNRVSVDTSEYVLKNKNEMFGYSYIYDCDLLSNVKRYSEDNIECINNIYNSKEIKNYYDSPKIYMEYDIKKNLTKYWVGRFASKTRMEQIDVLRFCMKLLKGENV